MIKLRFIRDKKFKIPAKMGLSETYIFNKINNFTPFSTRNLHGHFKRVHSALTPVFVNNFQTLWSNLAAQNETKQVYSVNIHPDTRACPCYARHFRAYFFTTRRLPVKGTAHMLCFRDALLAVPSLLRRPRFAKGKGKQPASPLWAQRSTHIDTVRTHQSKLNKLIECKQKIPLSFRGLRTEQPQRVSVNHVYPFITMTSSSIACLCPLRASVATRRLRFRDESEEQSRENRKHPPSSMGFLILKSKGQSQSDAHAFCCLAKDTFFSLEKKSDKFKKNKFQSELPLISTKENSVARLAFNRLKQIFILKKKSFHKFESEFIDDEVINNNVSNKCVACPKGKRKKCISTASKTKSSDVSTIESQNQIPQDQIFSLPLYGHRTSLTCEDNSYGAALYRAGLTFALKSKQNGPVDYIKYKQRLTESTLIGKGDQNAFAFPLGLLRNPRFPFATRKPFGHGTAKGKRSKGLAPHVSVATQSTHKTFTPSKMGDYQPSCFNLQIKSPTYGKKIKEFTLLTNLNVSLYRQELEKEPEAKSHLAKQGWFRSKIILCKARYIFIFVNNEKKRVLPGLPAFKVSHFFLNQIKPTKLWQPLLVRLTISAGTKSRILLLKSHYKPITGSKSPPPKKKLLLLINTLAMKTENSNFYKGSHLFALRFSFLTSFCTGKRKSISLLVRLIMHGGHVQVSPWLQVSIEEETNKKCRVCLPLRVAKQAKGLPEAQLALYGHGHAVPPATPLRVQQAKDTNQTLQERKEVKKVTRYIKEEKNKLIAIPLYDTVSANLTFYSYTPSYLYFFGTKFSKKQTAANFVGQYQVKKVTKLTVNNVNFINPMKNGVTAHKNKKINKNLITDLIPDFISGINNDNRAKQNKHRNKVSIQRKHINGVINQFNIYDSIINKIGFEFIKNEKQKIRQMPGFFFYWLIPFGGFVISRAILNNFIVHGVNITQVPSISSFIQNREIGKLKMRHTIEKSIINTFERSQSFPFFSKTPTGECFMTPSWLPCPVPIKGFDANDVQEHAVPPATPLLYGHGDVQQLKNGEKVYSQKNKVKMLKQKYYNVGNLRLSCSFFKNFKNSQLDFHTLCHCFPLSKADPLTGKELAMFFLKGPKLGSTEVVPLRYYENIGLIHFMTPPFAKAVPVKGKSLAQRACEAKAVLLRNPYGESFIRRESKDAQRAIASPLRPVKGKRSEGKAEHIVPNVDSSYITLGDKKIPSYIHPLKCKLPFIVHTASNIENREFFIPSSINAKFEFIIIAKQLRIGITRQLKSRFNTALQSKAGTQGLALPHGKQQRLPLISLLKEKPSSSWYFGIPMRLPYQRWGLSSKRFINLKNPKISYEQANFLLESFIKRQGLANETITFFSGLNFIKNSELSSMLKNKIHINLNNPMLFFSKMNPLEVLNSNKSLSASMTLPGLKEQGKKLLLKNETSTFMTPPFAKAVPVKGKSLAQRACEAKAVLLRNPYEESFIRRESEGKAEQLRKTKPLFKKLKNNFYRTSSFRFLIKNGLRDFEIKPILNINHSIVYSNYSSIKTPGGYQIIITPLMTSMTSSSLPFAKATPFTGSRSEAKAVLFRNLYGESFIRRESEGLHMGSVPSRSDALWAWDSEGKAEQLNVKSKTLLPLSSPPYLQNDKSQQQYSIMVNKIKPASWTISNFFSDYIQFLIQKITIRYNNYNNFVALTTHPIPSLMGFNDVTMVKPYNKNKISQFTKSPFLEKLIRAYFCNGIFGPPIINSNFEFMKKELYKKKSILSQRTKKQKKLIRTLFNNIPFEVVPQEAKQWQNKIRENPIKDGVRLFLNNHSFAMCRATASLSVPHSGQYATPLGCSPFRIADLLRVTKRMNNTVTHSGLRNAKSHKFPQQQNELQERFVFKKNIQKKHRVKKIRKQNISRKKRKRFYPRPIWLRYRSYLRWLVIKTPSNITYEMNKVRISKNKLIVKRSNPAAETFNYNISNAIKTDLYHKNSGSIVKRKNLYTYVKRIKEYLNKLRSQQSIEKIIERVLPFSGPGDAFRLLSRRDGSTATCAMPEGQAEHKAHATLFGESKSKSLFKNSTCATTHTKLNKLYKIQNKEEYNRIIYTRIQKIIQIANSLDTSTKLYKNGHKKFPLFSVKYAQLSSRDPQNNQNTPKRLKDLKTKSFLQTTWMWLYNVGYGNLCWGSSFGLNFFELPNKIKNIQLSWALKKTNNGFWGKLATKAKIEYKNNNPNSTLWSLQKLKNQGKSNKTKYLQRKFCNIFEYFLSGQQTSRVLKSVAIPQSLDNGLFSKSNLNIKSRLPEVKNLYQKILQKWKRKEQKIWYLGEPWQGKFTHFRKVGKAKNNVRILFMTPPFAKAVPVKGKSLAQRACEAKAVLLRNPYGESFIRRESEDAQRAIASSLRGQQLNNQFSKSQKNLVRSQNWWFDQPIVDYTQLTKKQKFRMLPKLENISNQEQAKGMHVIYSLFFHFCILISLISFSQIRSYLKFHFLILFKFTKSTPCIIKSLLYSIKKIIISEEKLLCTSCMHYNDSIFFKDTKDNTIKNGVLSETSKGHVTLRSLRATLLGWFPFYKVKGPCAVYDSVIYDKVINDFAHAFGKRRAFRCAAESAARTQLRKSTMHSVPLAHKKNKTSKVKKIIKIFLQAHMQHISRKKLFKNFRFIAKLWSPVPFTGSLAQRACEAKAVLLRNPYGESFIRRESEDAQRASRKRRDSKGKAEQLIYPHQFVYSLFANYCSKGHFNSFRLENQKLQTTNQTRKKTKQAIIIKILLCSLRELTTNFTLHGITFLNKFRNLASQGIIYLLYDKVIIILQNLFLIPERFFNSVTNCFRDFLKKIVTFLKNPELFINDFIGNTFLLEWTLDLQMLIPENLEIYTWNLLSPESIQIKRSIKKSLLFTTLSLGKVFIDFWSFSQAQLNLAFGLSMQSNVSINQRLENKLDLINLVSTKVGETSGTNFLLNKGINISSLLIITSFLQRSLSSMYNNIIYSFVHFLSQPDTDLILRQKKGTIYWDNWSEILTKAADKYNIIIPSLAILKDEQNKFMQKLMYSPRSGLWPVPTGRHDKNFANRLSSNSFRHKQGYIKGHMNGKKEISETQYKGQSKFMPIRIFFDGIFYSLCLASFRYASPLRALPKGRLRFRLPVKGTESEGQANKKNLSKEVITKILSRTCIRVPYSYHKPLTTRHGQPQPIKDGNACFKYRAIKIHKRSKAVPVKGKQRQAYSEHKAQHDPILLNGFSETWPVNQFVTYQSKDTDLFIDLHPPKSFYHISSVKYYYQIQQPLATLICSIYSGIFIKQPAKNILIIGQSAYEKNLLITALAGETELKVISDNATRYASIIGGVAVGLRLLRDVFDALVFHSPCLFLLENIHAIGEKRPLIFSDSTYSAEEGIFGDDFSGSQKIEEQNKISAESSNHVIKHYKKPYKGEFSSAIPTNHFSFDLFAGYTGSAIKQSLLNLGELNRDVPFGLLIIGQNKNKTRSRKNPIKISSSRAVPVKGKLSRRDSERSGLDFSARQDNALISRLQLKPDPLLVPPATSPLHVFAIKEQKKFQPQKIVKELPFEGLSNEQSNLIPKYSYSIRTKVAMLAENTLSNMSVKLDMITDLLMILDNVRTNRGFVVFATTHIPSVLDPALRRPGRLDETIRIPQIQNIWGRWQIFKTNLEHFFRPLNNCISLSSLSTSNICTIDLIDTPSNIGFLNGVILESGVFQGQIWQSQIVNKLYLAKQGMLPAWVDSIDLRVQHTNAATSAATSLSLLNLIKDEVCIYKEQKNSQVMQKNNIYTSLHLPCLPKARARQKVHDVNYLQSSQKEQHKKKYYKIKALTYFDVGKKLINITYSPINSNDIFYLTTEIQTATLYSNKTQLKTLLTRLFAGKISESFIFSSLHNFSKDRPIKSKLKRYTNNFLRGFQIFYGLDETWIAMRAPARIVFSLIQKRYMFSKNLIIPSLLSFAGPGTQPQSPPDSFILIPAKRYENYKRALVALETKSEITIGEKIQIHQQKRFIMRLYNLPVHESFRSETTSVYLSSLSSKVGSGSSLQKQFTERPTGKSYKSCYSPRRGLWVHKPVPCCPFASLALRSARACEATPSRSEGQGKATTPSKASKARQIDDGVINTNQYYSNSGNTVPFANAFLTLNPIQKSCHKITATNLHYRHKILHRHRQYLTNQWWSQQLAEYNTEAVFLSDVDWRYTFINSIGEFLIDYPDADQFYKDSENLGFGISWFNYNRIGNIEIFEHFIFESFVKTFNWLNKNREFLDYSAYKYQKKGFLKENHLINNFKRFSSLS
uniref:Cell division protein n=1 Tax=Oogamochlamys gigantea TaxID=158507 RepID=A0A0S2LN71_9CHLO|nr:cell division protein [Oogamochlamys gigantea]ALO62775.1 cell division protein [Oogamochlamys gigantea]